MKDILTTAKAAELLGVSIRTAQLWVESGQLPSWKTPGGHRRIPRQAVLDLIDAASPLPPAALAARVLILAAEGRGAEWQAVGLPNAGLLTDVTEDVAALRKRLAEMPPSVIVLEANRGDGRETLALELGRDPRAAATTIVTVSPTIERPVVSRNGRRIRLPRLADVPSQSAQIVAALGASREEASAAGFPTPLNEAARLEAVRRSGLVGSAPDSRFDRLVRLAATVTQAPIAMFTLITGDQQWFKARVGFEGESTVRDWAFCNETLVANELTVIEDMRMRPSLSTNPTLDAPYGFRFYAGAPVRDPLGFALGSVCVIDVVPRSLKPEEREALATIAEAVSTLVLLSASPEGAGRAQTETVLTHMPA
ncbi:helix-turn-helix domain-containing protein [Rhizobium sp. YIM 134829]|uniref:helix-turn-helix domain-containing protein n=1 Tax=Rhizobium sp. YIM 134829 TaxID=3390453 RepID=UPI0039781B85